MAEKKICKECRWNNYPECEGTINVDGSKMRIDKLRPIFNCGQKDLSILTDFSQEKDANEQEISDLKARITQLELKGVK